MLFLIRENTHSFAWNGNQQREDTFISTKIEHLPINQTQERFLHFNQHSIHVTFLGIHLRHSTYKREKYSFINANIRVINSILEVIRDNWHTLKCKLYSLFFYDTVCNSIYINIYIYIYIYIRWITWISLYIHIYNISIYIYIYIWIYKEIQVIHRWIQNSALQLRSGLTVNRLLNMSTYGF